MKIVSEENTTKHFTDAYANCSIRYGDMKKQLAEDMITFLTPIREKIEAISNDTSYLGKVAKLGAEKAHDSATKTMNEVRDVIGFRKFY
jgi:tryptophanyl-tRNA synthetase